MNSKRNVHGEGNYEASRIYNKATKQFVESGRVEQAARDAAPKTPAEAEEMKRAEEAGLQRAKVQPDDATDQETGDADTTSPDGSENTRAGRDDMERSQPRGR